MALNKEQSRAADHIEGQLLILAGAGSGKTTVLMQRIENMVAKGIEPKHILALTFTNKAAEEMRERISNKIGNEQASNLWMSTFHSMCVKILRKYAHTLGTIKNDFTIYDATNAKDLLKQIIKDCGYAPSKTKKNDKPVVKPETMLHFISSLKNEMIDVKTFQNEKPSHDYIDWKKSKELIYNIDNETKEYLHQIYPEYQKRLEQYNAVDFDDLILHTLHLFMKNPSVLAVYQKQFQYIMVDEYQDTNHAQYILIKLLANKNGNLAVVGDDFQSIYAFRGSDIRNILNFDKDYPNATVIKLEQNYRSTQNILDAANQVISRNKNQKEKKLFTTHEEGELITFCETKNDYGEAEYIANEIKQALRNGRNYDDFTVLYRSNAQSGIIETIFQNAGIPCKVFGGKSFFDRAEIRDMISYLSFIKNPVDPVHFTRIINQPKRGIGATTVQKILQNVGHEGILNFLENPDRLNRVNQKTKDALADFVSLIKKYQGLSKRIGTAGLMTDLIKEINYFSVFDKEERSKRREKEDNINQLILIAKEKENKKGDTLKLSEFLDDITLKTDEKEEQDSFVKLMTIHASKGLEFPFVFLAGMKEKGFPSPYAVTSDEIEEERRLCYVAFTRAKEKLYLTYPDRSFSRKDNDYIQNMLSRFLSEFDSSLIQNDDYDPFF